MTSPTENVDNAIDDDDPSRRATETPSDARVSNQPKRVEVTNVSWFTQVFSLVVYKNIPMLRRRPVHLMLMLFSSVFSVLLAWPAAREDSDRIVFPLDECGMVSEDFLDSEAFRSLDGSDQRKYKTSLNTVWLRALPVAVLGLGPLLFGICVYLIVHEEIQLQLLAVLRGVGMSNSAYWASWYFPLMIIAMLNSMLAGITAKLVPIHVFEATYFGGIFASFFFIQLALMGASFFMAALSGKARRGAVWLILCMLIAAWIPITILNFRKTNSSASAAPSLFWSYERTGQSSQTCADPFISESEAANHKTEAEQLVVSLDQVFVGCYSASDFGAVVWAPQGWQMLSSSVLWFFPYFHFQNIWGNFAGFTAWPDREFNAKHASMRSGALARAALNGTISEEIAQGTELFPQGSMVFDQPSECKLIKSEGGYEICDDTVSNCPGGELPTNLPYCGSQTCRYAKHSSPIEGKSAHFNMLMLILLSLVYTLMAAYWGIAFVGGEGTLPFYFPFLPEFWVASKKKIGVETADMEANEAAKDVKVENVNKYYGGNHALRNVSLTMASGEVTALLGHNGAGKTTLSKILTCEIPASAGDISVFGHSVRYDSAVVRRLVGFCKQDNYLWPNLSAREHLELFAGLQGADRSEIGDKVQEWLDSVDLSNDQNMLPSQYSGGMKRRLSLALSTIGGRPLIVLDEPTTGMDPVSRRFVWNHIDAIREDRVILLTTHAMEEADLLADMVAIMRGGVLAAFDSPLELKSTYGSALQFNIMVESDKLVQVLSRSKEVFADEMQWVKFDSGDSGNITATIKKIRQRSGDPGVEVSTLLNFVDYLEDPSNDVTEHGFANSSLEEVFLEITKDSTVTHAEATAGAWAPDTRQLNQAFDGAATTQSDDNVVVADWDGTETGGFDPQLSVWRQLKAILWLKVKKSWTGSSAIGNWVAFGIFLLISTLVSVELAYASFRAAGFTMQVAILSFLLLSISSSIYSDKTDGMFYLMRTQGLLKNSYLLGTGLYGFLLTFAYATLMLGFVYATPWFREPILCPENSFCEQKFGRFPISTDQQVVDASLFGSDQVLLRADLIPGGYHRVFGAGLFFSLSVPGSALASSYLPGHKFALVTIAFLSFCASILPMILFFAFPYQESQLESGEFVSPCVNRIIPNFEVKCLSADTINESFLDCISALDYDGVGTFCIPSMAGILPQIALFQMLGLGLNTKIRFSTSPASDFVRDNVIPTLKSKGFSCSGDSCISPLSRRLYGENAGWSLVGSIILLVAGLIVANIFAFPSAPVLFVKNIIGQWVKFLLYHTKQNGAGGTVVAKEELAEVADERSAVQDILNPYLNPLNESSIPEIVNRSALSRNKLPPIITHKLRKEYPSVGSLPPKVALDSLDLQVPKGQILGFLGKNGAGKTTALKILAGAHDATSGIGLVNGYDASCERLKIFETLGNCPQFDVIWPKLTVREHLVFFAMLKGLDSDDAERAASLISKAVGLGAPEVHNRWASALSGGMRRRLSIAIALVGMPDVFVLDEPTTGLDPSTRNNIWNLISSIATPDRAVVITTHMMLEADTLCNRIAIISRGKLVVTATQQALKDKFGSGYLLQLNLAKNTPENQEAALSFVREYMHADATVGTKQAKTLHINLSRDLDHKKAFKALYDLNTRPACINQFLLSQSSLEDVFLSLGDYYE